MWARITIAQSQRLFVSSSNRVQVSARRHTSSTTQRPLSELYYHLLATPKNLETQFSSKHVYAISFLPEPPASGSESKTILGFVPALEEGESSQEPGLNDFKENRAFLDLLHKSVRKSLKEQVDEAVSAEATQRRSGWLHIQDERNVPALGRIGDPDDIIASVRVEDGEILTDTYQPMPSYRVFTADGPPKLSEGLAKKLEDALVSQQRLEKSL